MKNNEFLNYFDIACDSKIIKICSLSYVWPDSIWILLKYVVIFSSFLQRWIM